MIRLHIFRDATREEHVDEAGRWHREGGPALVCSTGTEAWYRHGKLHREDGPAIVDPGSGYKAWFLDGVTQRVEHPSGVVFSRASAAV